MPSSHTISHIIWSCLFLLLVLLPGTQTIWGYIPERQTSGVENRAPLSTPNFETFSDGSFQRQFENWLSKNIGLRGSLVRTDNQINFSLFNQFSSNSRFQVILGKDHYLFERGYVSSYVHSIAMTNKRLKTTVRQLKRLQEELQLRHKGFLLLISPSKAALYEEYLPEQYRRRRRPGPTTFDLLMPLLPAESVNVLDGVSMARTLKTQGHPVFSRGSTHWTFSSACVVAAEVMRRFESQTGAHYPAMPCSPAPISDVPWSQDNDLSGLSNLWSINAFNQPLPYPEVSPSRDSLTTLPTVFSVGSSFMWSILYYLDAYHAYGSRDFFYYFKTKHSFPSNKKAVVDPRTFDWEKEVFSKDLVLIEINQYSLEDLGFGFVQGALRYLKQQKTALTPGNTHQKPRRRKSKKRT